ncbi:Mbeg1-like protein [Streptococcus dentasini]
MPTLLDYINNNAQTSFASLPLNGLDLALMNELGYLPLGEGQAQAASIALQDLQEKFASDSVAYSFIVNKQRVAIFQAMSKAPRFKDLQLSHYVNSVDAEYEKQFAAMVMELPHISHCQVVFRGTDETLIGWKEDFKMTYMSEIPAQRQAALYLRHILLDGSGPVILTGHSKGGNLALYAAAHLPAALQARIKQIFIFDAPGLHEHVLKSAGYQAIRHKICSIRPKDSIVGSMLNNDITSTFVDSKAIGVFQHNTTTWEIDGHLWKIADGQTALSQALELTFRKWTQELPNQELKIFFDTIFDLFMENDLATLDDLKADVLKSTSLFTSALSQLPVEKRQILTKSTISLLELFMKSRVSQLRLPKIKLLLDPLKTFLEDDVGD